MNSRTLMVIVVMGALGAFAVVIAGMIGIQAVADKPLVIVALEVANHHKVTDVSVAVVPPTGNGRVLKVGYESPALLGSIDAETAEMESVAKYAWERVRLAESSEDFKRKVDHKDPIARGPIEKVLVRRTWRSKVGCSRKPDIRTSEWTPPPLPPPGRP